MPVRRNAIIYCERGLRRPIGKTAHGLIRQTERYKVVGVVDSKEAGRDAGEVLDGKMRGIPVFPSIKTAVLEASPVPSTLVVGLAPTGFGGERLLRAAASEALTLGLSVHSGLHDYLSEIPYLRRLALRKGLEIIDVRKPPARRLAMLSGAILNVTTPRLLVTGQDAAVGKRTAALRLQFELSKRGLNACVIGTGQTAWLQGVKYGIRLDALPLDFAGGELESEIVRAYKKENPDLLIIEGQGSLLNPGYSCETIILITASRPSMLVYVAVPARTRYIDFPDFPIRAAATEIELLESISQAPVLGVIINSSSESPQTPDLREGIAVAFGPDGNFEPLIERIVAHLPGRRGSMR